MQPFLGTNYSRRVSIPAWDDQSRVGGHIPEHHTSRPRRSFSVGFRLSSRAELPRHLGRTRVSQRCLSHSAGTPRRYPEPRNTGCWRYAVLQLSRQLHVVPGISLQLSKLHRSRKRKQPLRALPQNQHLPRRRRLRPSQQPMPSPWWPRGRCPLHHLPRRPRLPTFLGRREPLGAPWAPL